MAVQKLVLLGVKGGCPRSRSKKPIRGIGVGVQKLQKLGPVVQKVGVQKL